MDGREEAALKTWLRASNKAGVHVPWVYVRRKIAERWHVPPWVVDDSPWDEVDLEMRLANIEAECPERR